MQWRPGVLSTPVSERAWEARQLSCSPKLGGYGENVIQSLAIFFFFGNQYFLTGTQLSLNWVLFQHFWLPFCLLLWTEMALFSSY